MHCKEFAFGCLLLGSGNYNCPYRCNGADTDPNLLLAPPAVSLHDQRADLRRVWWLLVALGLLAISSCFIVFTTWALVVFFGALLLIAVITEVIQAVMVRN
jgi:hypothetical protein